MSGRAAYSSGADAYLGANEASALVGAWRQLGSDVQITNRGFGGGFGQQPHHHHHRGQRGQRWGGQQQPQYGAQSPYVVRQPATNYGTNYQNQGGTNYYQNPTASPWFGGGAQAPQGGVQVRDHRISGASRQAAAQAWNQRHPGVPFVGVEALMGAVAQAAGADLGPQPRAWLRDMAPPDMANRQVLPMNTGTTPVPQNSTAQITSRPQRVAFRPERVFVSSGAGVDAGGNPLTAASWIINDITIGNRSQFAQSGALPGDMFSNVAIDSFVTFETAQTAMDVVMIVTYQGPIEGGIPFYGSIIGTAAV